MRRVLFISYAFPPLRMAEALQAWRMARGLAGHGWTPTVLTVTPESSHEPSDPIEIGEDGESVRVPSCEPRVLRSLCWRLCRALLAMPDDKRLWVRRAVAAGRRLLARGAFDVILTRACPLSCHLVGLALKRRFGTPWVAHFSDPWTASPYFPRHAPWQVRYNQRLEARVFASADRVTFTNAFARDDQLALYGDEVRRKADVVPHATDLSLRRAAPDPDRARPLRLLHTGSLYGLRTGRALYGAVQRVASQMPGAVRLTLLGPIEPGECEMLRRMDPAGLVHTRETTTFADALDAMRQADVLVAIDAPSVSPCPFLPSKLYDYLIADHPILALTPARGAAADFVRCAGGLQAPPDDPEAIADAVRDLVRRREQGELGRLRPDPAFVRDQDVAPAAGRLARVLASAADLAGRRPNA